MEKQTFFEQLLVSAPAVPPSWWKPEMREKPILLDRLNLKFSSQQERDWLKLYNDEDSIWPDEGKDWVGPNVPQEFKDAVKAHEIAWNARYDEVQEWEKEYKIESVFQWPFYYSNEMLKRVNIVQAHVNATKKALLVILLFLGFSLNAQTVKYKSLMKPEDFSWTFVVFNGNGYCPNKAAEIIKDTIYIYVAGKTGYDTLKLKYSGKLIGSCTRFPHPNFIIDSGGYSK